MTRIYNSKPFTVAASEITRVNYQYPGSNRYELTVKTNSNGFNRAVGSVGDLGVQPGDMLIIEPAGNVDGYVCPRGLFDMKYEVVS